MVKRHRYKVEKLVRDKTPERLKNKGVANQYRILDLDEHIIELGKKLIEESTEVKMAVSKDEKLSELADILELIHSFARAIDESFEKVEIIRQEKLATRGSFDKHIYAIYSELDEDNWYYNYYQSNADRYPEIEIPKEK